MNGFVKNLSWLTIIAGCIAIIPLAVTAGLLILGTDPNPRHPPQDLFGEAVGWAIIALLAGSVSTIIGESLTMPEGRGALIDNRGIFYGGAVGMVIALFFGTNLAVLQMASVDGQAITSVDLGILAGGTVSAIACVAGIVMGDVLRRMVLAVFSLR